MAPTEVLAAQHYRSLTALLAPFGFRVELLSGSLTKAQKNGVHERLRSGGIDVIVGTNALIQPDVHYRRSDWPSPTNSTASASSSARHW